jgi:dolichol-phosphate mannosyltransferase
VHQRLQDRAASADLAIIVPTFNEAANLEPLLERVERVLAGLSWELIFVDDDSPDGTADQVRARARVDRRVRCIQRIGRRGLSGAVIEGMLSTAAPAIAVMDGDLQHDETILPIMLAQIRDGGADLVVATRYAAGGGVQGWQQGRQRMSRLATTLAQRVLAVRTSDPMSGFFLLRSDVFHASVRRLSGQGYKILLDLLASHPGPLRLAEVPYRFSPRLAGQSKLDAMVMWEFVLLLLDKRFGQWVPPRLFLFLMVGGSGVLVHLAVLIFLHRGLDTPFMTAQSAATLVAMSTNYTANNLLTYRDRRRRGWRWLTGLASFWMICGLGVIANVGVAATLVDHRGWFLAAMAGILVGTVWNYAASAALTWKRNP